MYKEIYIGAALAVIMFFGYIGVNILPFVFFIGLIGVLYYSNINKLTKSSAGFTAAKKTSQNISFDDIGGQDVAKTELCEALDFIKNDEYLKTLGIRPLKGILLNGPPGTGKTLLAKAAAQYTDSIFISASGSEFVEMYVGVGAQRVRKLFSQARQMAKQENKNSAVIFIDEMEVLGGIRGKGNNNQEHEQTLNELLVQMDGISYDDNIKILIIGATNRVDMLDSALLRPGRFDRQVKVDLPDKKGRMHILKLHTRNKPLAQDVQLDVIAKDTFGFSGAQLESVANEAAILAMREKSNEITKRHLQNAIEKVMMGEVLDRVPNKDEKNRISIHESAHALMGELKFPGSVASVNIASRSNALGYVRQSQDEDMYLYTQQYLESKIAVALAGAAAEEIVLKSRSTGGSSDFKYASDYAKHMIYSGMSEIGLISVEDIPKEQLHVGISQILKRVDKEVLDILEDKKAVLLSISQLLNEKETISGDELRDIMNKSNI